MGEPDPQIVGDHAHHTAASPNRLPHNAVQRVHAGASHRLTAATTRTVTFLYSAPSPRAVVGVPHDPRVTLATVGKPLRHS